MFCIMTQKCPIFCSQLLVVLGILLKTTEAGYTISWKMIRFDSFGELIDGRPCDNFFYGTCDTYLKFCIDPIAQTTNNPSLENCTTVYRLTNQFDNTNNLIFQSGTVYGDWENPQEYYVDEDQWLGVYFKLRAYDGDAIFDTDDLIDEYMLVADATFINADVGYKLFNYSHPRNGGGRDSYTEFSINVETNGSSSTTDMQSSASLTVQQDASVTTNARSTSMQHSSTPAESNFVTITTTLPTSTAAMAYCNEPHGTLHCACQYGYTGQTCDAEINWCNERLVESSDNATIAGVCSLNGYCISNASSGASCICREGFSGVFCQQVDNIHETVSKRCALYATTDTTTNNITVGCDSTKRCILDDLDCAYSHCDYPIGWCIPKPTAHRILKYQENQRRNGMVDTIRTEVASSPCNGRGQPSCSCTQWYTGERCQEVITTTLATTSTVLPTTTTPDLTTPKASCAVWRQCGANTTGYYDILFVDSSNNTVVKSVRCDMTTDGGGWTVIQRRASSTIDFFRPWEDYRLGFGDSSSFWIGNDFLYYLTNQNGPQALRIDIEDCTQQNFFAKYAKFMIFDESHNYTLSVTDYDSGSTAGDSLGYGPGGNFYQNGHQFGTCDRGHDNYRNQCPCLYEGGWWFNRCGVSNLNGIYYDGCYYTSIYQDGVYWHTLRNDNYSFKLVEMKIRPRDFVSP